MFLINGKRLLFFDLTLLVGPSIKCLALSFEMLLFNFTFLDFLILEIDKLLLKDFKVFRHKLLHTCLLLSTVDV